MHLPGRLRRSTLGDLLGTLHRATITGILQLREISGPRAGKVHRIHLRAGEVIHVDLDASEGSIPPPTAALDRAIVRGRLERLFALDDAEISFRVARPHGSEALATPLQVAEFLHGRPRARERNQETPCRGALPSELLRARSKALSLLGLPLGASLVEVQRAFRTLAFRLHPDRFPHAASAQRQALVDHFVQLTQAYHTLAGA